MLSKPQRVLVVDLFPEILEELLSLLADITPDEWSRPTICAGWSVKDVALHLLGIEIGNLSRRRDGQVDPGPPISNWGELVAVLKDWNESWVVSARRMSIPLLIDLLRYAGRQWCEYVRTLDPYALGGSVAWAGPQLAPIWLDLAREYSERWHHQQHIRDAVGRPGLKQPRYLAPVLATFAWALPRAFEGAPAEDGTTVTLTIHSASGGQWTVMRAEATWQLYAGAPYRPSAEVEMDEETAWRLFTRGLSATQTKERIHLNGDQQLAGRILEMVSIIA
jgi:uncharacterized protein (TIGR03083 family)